MSLTILHIETSAETCSVALSEDTNLVSYKETNDSYSHAKNLAIFIDDILKKNNIRVQDLSAIAVSEGPGSYTGLRIGVSTAKGMAYATGIPIIAINTLKIICYGVKQEQNIQNQIIIPMIDARRNEVYTAIFDNKCNCIQKTHSLILDANSFGQILKENKAIIAGNGATKAKKILNADKIIFSEHITAKAKFMITPAIEKFQKNNFVNTAYFDPFYLKPFIATKAKNKILSNLKK